MLNALGVAPLDVVYGVDASTSPTQPNAALSDIEQRVIYVAKHMTGGFDPGADLRLQHARPGDLAAGETTLFDVLEQARAAGRLIAGLRGADPEDLNPPERTGVGTIDLTELEARVVAAEKALSAAHSGLGALVASATKTAEALRGGLLALGAFGVGPAVPVISGGERAADVLALAAQAAALMKTSGGRLDQGAALRAQAVATDPRARAGQLADRMRACSANRSLFCRASVAAWRAPSSLAPWLQVTRCRAVMTSLRMDGSCSMRDFGSRSRS